MKTGIDKIHEYWTNFKRGELPYKIDRAKFSQDMQTSHSVVYMLIKLCELLQRGEKYINLGVYRGGTLLTVADACKKVQCLGIDSFVDFDRDGRNETIVRNQIGDLGLANCELVRSDFFKWAAEYEGRDCGLFFADGWHSEDATFRAMVSMIPFMTSRCAMVIDDTDTPAVRAGVDKFLSDQSEWRVVYDIAGVKKYKDINMAECWWEGIIVICKGL